MTRILEVLSGIITANIYLAPVLAFIAGILTSFTPCSLSGISLIIGFVSGTGQKDPRRAFRLSVVFAIGTAFTFTILGTVASFAGRLIGMTASWWYIILGIIMMLMALQTWGIYEIIPSSYLVNRNIKRGSLGAFISGILGGIFSSPCSTPVLIVLLAIAAGEGSILKGMFLLMMYSAGHGILAVAAGTSVGFIQKLMNDKKYGKANNILKIVMGTVIIFIGFYMFYLGF